MRDKEIKEQAIKTLIDVSEVLDIPIFPKNKLHAFLQKVGLKRKVVSYTLRKMRVGSRERVALKLFNFPDLLLGDTLLLKRIFQLSKDHHKDLVYCVGVALQNDRNEPSASLLDNLNWVSEELFQYILEKSLGQIDIQNFLKSIVMLTGTGSLIQAENEEQTSLSDSGEIIAPGIES